MLIKFYVKDSYSYMSKMICFVDSDIIIDKPLTVNYTIYCSLRQELQKLRILFMNRCVKSITFDRDIFVVTKFPNNDWQIVIGIIGMFVEKYFENNKLNLLEEQKAIQCHQHNYAENIYVKLLQHKINEHLNEVVEQHNGYITVIDVNVQDRIFDIQISGSCTSCTNQKKHLRNIIEEIVLKNFPSYKTYFL